MKILVAIWLFVGSLMVAAPMKAEQEDQMMVAPPTKTEQEDQMMVAPPTKTEPESVERKQKRDVDVAQEFMHALGKNDLELAKSFVKSSVTIPEIRERTPLVGVQGLPSPDENSTVMVGYFGRDHSDEGDAQRIAFIWEVTVKGDKISRIKVVSDDSNPHMNERIVVKKYKKKFKRDVLVPTYFPFTVTHVDGKVTGNEMVIDYRNEALKFMLEVKAVPRMNRAAAPKNYSQQVLKNGKPVYFKVEGSGFQLVFEDGDLEYTIKLEGENETFKPKEEELMQVVESMFQG